MGSHWNDNGDLVIETHNSVPSSSDQRFIFRQVGWQINGGPNNGIFVDKNTPVTSHQLGPHGSVSPIYIQIEDD